jgi:hypothetical protein
MAERKHYCNDDEKYLRTIEHINDSFMKMEMEDSSESNRISNMIGKYSEDAEGDSLIKEINCSKKF